MPLITNLGVGVPTSGIEYAFSIANFALDMIITAAEERGVGKLLSKPKVITQNNEKATVKQGTKIPVQTIVNNTVSVQFVDAVLELDVTPQITADGTIYMDVTVEKRPDRRLDSARSGYPGDRHAVGRNQGHRQRRSARWSSAESSSRSRPTDIQQVPFVRQRADPWQPVQAHDGQVNFTGAAVLPDASHSAELA